MPKLELSDVPEQLYRRLEVRANQHGQSVENEAIGCIQSALDGTRDPAQVLERARRLRKSLEPMFLTDEAIRAAREEGRA